MSNLNHILFQKIVQDFLKFHALKRHELRCIVIPKVCQVIKVLSNQFKEMHGGKDMKLVFS